MGAAHSLINQLDCIGPESVVSHLSQCQLVDTQVAIRQLRSGSNTVQQRISTSSLALSLPLPISTATAFVSLLEDKDTNSTDVIDCFSVLTFFGCGSVEERVHLFYMVHGWGRATEVDKSVIETALLRLLHSVDRVYQADPWIQITSGTGGLYNLLNVAAELVEEIEYLTQRTSFHYSDLEKWLMASLTACFPNEAMYSTIHPCDKEFGSSTEYVVNSISVSGSSSSSNSSNSYTWVKVACDESRPIPSSRSKHAITVHDGYIYLHGGRDRTIGQKDMWRFEIASNQWERMTCNGDRPFLLQDHTMIAYNGKLYVFGGEFSASWSNEAPLWELDIAQKKWSKPKQESDVMVPCNRRCHSAVITNHQMHIYGGFLDLKGSNGELWTYDLEHSMWHLTYRAMSADDGPGIRHSHSAVVHNHSMWVYGGMSDLTPRSDLWCWHFKQRKWTKFKNKNGPPALAGHSACKIPRSMIIYGGESAGVAQGDLWRYTFDTQMWQKLVSDGLPPVPRSYHCTIVLPSFVLQQAWLAAGNDRSLSVPLLKPSSHTASIDLPRPRSSPAGNMGGKSYQSFRNSVAPVGGPVELSIGRPGHLSARTTEILSSPKPQSQDQFNLMKQVTEKLGKFSKSTDTVELLKLDGESEEVYKHASDWARLEGNNIEATTVEDRAEAIRRHIHQMRKTKTMDSVSLCRLLSTESQSSEEWLAYDNCVSLDSSGHFSCLLREDDGHSPTKRPKNYHESLGCKAYKSASVESILSMSHNPKLPPPYYLNNVPRKYLSQDSLSCAIKSRSWDSLLKSFGGVGLSCVDIANDPSAVELTDLNPSADLVLEDLEDCDTDQLDITPTSESPQHATPINNPHISIVTTLEQTSANRLTAWTDTRTNTTGLSPTSPVEIPDLLRNVANEDPIMAYRQSSAELKRLSATNVEMEKSTKPVTSTSCEPKRTLHYEKQQDRPDGSIELTDFSQKGTMLPPGEGLKKYLSHMGVRTIDTVHMYVFGGKEESESGAIGVKPLPVWRLDVQEHSTRRPQTENKRK